MQEWGAAHSAASETPSFFAAPIAKGRAEAMDGDASFAHAPQDRGERHVRQRPARACVERGEHEFVDADACHMMEQGRSRFAARHSSLAAGGVIHVRASQSISAHVALRTSFVRQAVRIVKASALEAISVRSLSRLSHCGVMGNATHFGRRRQQMVEMTSPGRRIFTLAIFVDCRPGKHALKTLGRPG